MILRTGITGPLTIAVDALDVGGTGAFVGTAVVNGQEFPTNKELWRCYHGSVTSEGEGSHVNSGWHGERPADGWETGTFDDSAVSSDGVSAPRLLKCPSSHSSTNLRACAFSGPRQPSTGRMAPRRGAM